ncbi:MAG: hypothetical protein M1817_002949 [Caeruleum heppii]|nr:MAG: hypothetical protein M1817_002949 [Caeruleum heppii]
MRRIPPSSRSLDLFSLLYRPSLICRTACPNCGTHLPPANRLAQFSTSTSRRESIPFTEKLRRKIWGTDQPPGQRDPYAPRETSDQQVDRGAEEGQEGAQVEPRAEAESSSAADTYEPATTWDGLDMVGGVDEARLETWDRRHQFKPFIPTAKLTTRQELTVALHRAVVEVYTLRQAQRDPTRIASTHDSEDHTLHVTASPEGQEVTLQYPDEEARNRILQACTISKRSAKVDETSIVDAETTGGGPVTTERNAEEVMESELAEEEARIANLEDLDRIIAPWGSSWLDLSLSNPSDKFAIFKRVAHLTGTRIADPVLSTSQTVSDILAHLLTPPKPPKLYDALQDKEELVGLPNVAVYPRRVTPIDKQVMVGRWKVIERELRKRGLPVTGRA